MSEAYAKFIASKKRTARPMGFIPSAPLNANLFNWQARIDDGARRSLPRKTAERAAYFDLRRLIGSVPVPQVIRDAVRL